MSEDTVVIVRDILVSFLDNKNLARLGCTCRGMRDACRKQTIKNKRKFARTLKELAYLARLTRDTRDNLMTYQYDLHWWYHCHVQALLNMFYHFRPMIRYRDIFPVAVQYDLATRDPRLRMIVKNLDASDLTIDKYRHCWNDFTIMLTEQRDAWLDTYLVRLQQMHYPLLLDVETGMTDYFLTVNHGKIVHYLLEHGKQVMAPVVELLHKTVFPGLRKFRKAIGKYKAKKKQAMERSLSLLGDRAVRNHLRRISFRSG
jgi:hypothetical protein